MLRLVLFLGFLLFPISLFAEDCLPFGELTTLPEMYPPRALHMSWTASSALPKCQNKPELQLNTSWSSTNASRQSYIIDGEMLQYRASYIFEPAQHWLASIHLPVVQRTPGTFDGFINWYHDLLSLPEGDRDKVEKDKFQMIGEFESGEVFENHRVGARQGNVEIWLKRFLKKVDHFSFAGELRASLPTSADGFGHRGIDAGLALTTSYQSDALLLDLNLAYLYFGRPQVGVFQFKNSHVESNVRLSYQLLDTLQAAVAVSYATETLTQIEDHPRDVGYMDFTMSTEIDDGVLLDLILREDIFSGYGASDVALLFGLRLS